MGMICYLLGVTPGQIGTLQAAPTMVSKLTAVAEYDASTRSRDEARRAMSAEQRTQSEARQAASDASSLMTSYRARIEEGRQQVASIGPLRPAFCLEKSWHILHYLFTGHIGPANAPGDLLMTGAPLGEDMVYGPARVHDPGQTREFGEFLQALDLARLQARINLEEMEQAHIYGMPFGGSPAEHVADLRDAVGQHFPRLRDYVRAMSSEGNALLIWLS